MVSGSCRVTAWAVCVEQVEEKSLYCTASRVPFVLRRAGTEGTVGYSAVCTICMCLTAEVVLVFHLRQLDGEAVLSVRMQQRGRVYACPGRVLLLLYDHVVVIIVFIVLLYYYQNATAVVRLRSYSRVQYRPHFRTDTDTIHTTIQLETRYLSGY
jgi:hypothetical protein